MLNEGSRHSDISFFIDAFEYLLKQYLQYLYLLGKKKHQTQKTQTKKPTPKPSTNSQRKLIKYSLHLLLLIHSLRFFQLARSRGDHRGRKASSLAAAPHHSNQDVSHRQLNPAGGRGAELSSGPAPHRLLGPGGGPGRRRGRGETPAAAEWGAARGPPRRGCGARAGAAPLSAVLTSPGGKGPGHPAGRGEEEGGRGGGRRGGPGAAGSREGAATWSASHMTQKETGSSSQSCETSFLFSSVEEEA